MGQVVLCPGCVSIATSLRGRGEELRPTLAPRLRVTDYNDASRAWLESLSLRRKRRKKLPALELTPVN